MADLSASVAAIVAAHPDGISAADVAARVAASPGTVRKVLARLAGAGQVRRIAPGVFGPVTTGAAPPAAPRHLAVVRGAAEPAAEVSPDAGTALTSSETTSPAGETSVTAQGGESPGSTVAGPVRHCPCCSALAVDPGAERCDWCGWRLAAVHAPGADAS